MNKNQKLLESFMVYCKQHPDERLWQALRNWSKSAFILTARNYNFNEDEYIGIHDTFYDEK